MKHVENVFPYGFDDLRKGTRGEEVSLESFSPQSRSRHPARIRKKIYSAVWYTVKEERRGRFSLKTSETVQKESFEAAKGRNYVKKSGEFIGALFKLRLRAISILFLWKPRVERTGTVPTPV